MDAGKRVVLIYLGDHDPSGIDMTRDIEDRLGTFMMGKGASFSGVLRIALNMDQVEEYQPPENPAKSSDSRFKSYVIEFGPSSWELDALEPVVLSKLVEDSILKHLDIDLFQGVVDLENEHKEKLKGLRDLL